MTGRRIAVAMSGGVDSSVAAALLHEQGEDVFGLMLRLPGSLPSGSNRCCSPSDMSTARQVAAQLNIPFHVIDGRQPFGKWVLGEFARGYAQGLTPNPCLNCNLHVRWTFLLDHALTLGASHLATGHYARLDYVPNRYRLLRARDLNKDQTYVLSFLRQDHLAHTMFPLGDLTKTEVRDHARRLSLPVADRPDSQDLCFLGTGEDYRDFLRQQPIPLPSPGPIVDRQGTVLGQHQGLANYTIGQRKGIQVTAPYPLYVLHKDIATNTLVVGPRQAGARNQFMVGGINWIAGTPPSPPVRAAVRVRYRAPEAMAQVRLLSPDQAEIVVDEPIHDVTPGQAAVLYDGDYCLGGGIIRP